MTALPEQAEVRTIACLMLNGIGDLLCVTPAFEALKKRYPKARLTVLIRHRFPELVENNPFVDDIISCGYNHRSKIVFGWQLRRRKFDLWIDLHVPTYNTRASNDANFRRNQLFMRFACPRYRVGYAVPQLSPYLTHPVPIPDETFMQSANIVDQTLALIGPRDDAANYEKSLTLVDADRRWASATFPDREAPRIGLFFGSIQPADIWPFRRLHDFIRLVIEEIPGIELVLIGGRFEQDMADRLLASVSDAPDEKLRNFINNTTLGQTAAMISRLDVLIASDSGPMHIADSLGIPLVALFSSKNHQAIWRPRSSRSIVLNHQVDCGPCFRERCHLQNKCMDLITPDEVLDALREMMAPLSGASTSG